MISVRCAARAAVVAVVCVFLVSAAAAVDIQTVTVGNPGNAGEWSGQSYGGYGPDRICGAVAYTYNIGKYEVTAGQYTEFLNAVAKTDTYGLYSKYMWSESMGCKIQRSGSSGSYTYSVASDYANRPVNRVSWGDAARFTNWLHNGQPTGGQGLTTTEDGAYYLNGATGDAQLLAVSRKAGATWAITSEDEWYKAAYYTGGGTNAGYWDYPTKSDIAPSNVGSHNYTDPGNHANYYNNGYTIGSPYYRTNVGEFENSASAYGTFDQGGNVWEWNESILSGSYRGVRGGSFCYNGGSLHASNRIYNYGNTPGESIDIGFRVSVAYVPQAKTYGIFIGSNDYKADGTIKVNGQTDAEKVYAKFNQLVTFSDVKLLNYSVADTSSTPIEAIKAALDAYTNVLQPGDSLIFFYSGHGGGSTTNPAVNESLYVTKTAISGEFVDDDLTAWFLDGSRKDKWAGVNKMFLLDSCFSGGFWNGENQDLNSLQKVALLAAAGELQYAQADPDHNGEGFFSMALEDGLLKVGSWAKADENKDGLTAEELKLWLENYVLPVNAVGYVKQDWPDDLVPVEWQVVGAASGDFDMVVPEPATLSLLALGGLVALVRRRRRKKSALKPQLG